MADIKTLFNNPKDAIAAASLAKDVTKLAMNPTKALENPEAVLGTAAKLVGNANNKVLREELAANLPLPDMIKDKLKQAPEIPGVKTMEEGLNKLKPAAAQIPTSQVKSAISQIPGADDAIKSVTKELDPVKMGSKLSGLIGKGSKTNVPTEALQALMGGAIPGMPEIPAVGNLKEQGGQLLNKLKEIAPELESIAGPEVMGALNDGLSQLQSAAGGKMPAMPAIPGADIAQKAVSAVTDLPAQLPSATELASQAANIVETGGKAIAQGLNSIADLLKKPGMENLIGNIGKNMQSMNVSGAVSDVVKAGKTGLENAPTEIKKIAEDIAKTAANGISVG